jgi:hypothetical protein
MFKRIAVIAGVVAAAALAVAPIGSAAKPADPGKGGRCIAAGVGTLVSLDAISAAARGELDYAPYGLNGLGLIRVALPAGSYLPLSTVIGLHRTNPELFAWCDSV